MVREIGPALDQKASSFRQSYESLDKGTHTHPLVPVSTHLNIQAHLLRHIDPQHPLMPNVRRLPGFLRSLTRDGGFVDYWRTYGWG